jgi:hypothetical protein
MPTTANPQHSARALAIYHPQPIASKILKWLARYLLKEKAATHTHALPTHYRSLRKSHAALKAAAVLVAFASGHRCYRRHLLNFLQTGDLNSQLFHPLRRPPFNMLQLPCLTLGLLLIS